MRRLILAWLLLLCILPGVVAEATEDNARAAIDDAKNHIEILQGYGYRTNALSDLLRVAEDAIEAKQYDTAIHATQQINERYNQAIEIAERLRSFDIQATSYENLLDFTEARQYRYEAETAFAYERYEEALRLVEAAERSFEAERAELTSTRILVAAGSGVIQENALLASIISLLVVIGAFVVWKWRIILRLKRELASLHREESVLGQLMEETQRAWFQHGKISGSLYAIRMDTYRQRLNNVKTRIPVVETELRLQKKHFLLRQKKKRLPTLSADH